MLQQCEMCQRAGWICPTCRAVWAPWVQECKHCGPRGCEHAAYCEHCKLLTLAAKG